MKNTGCGDWYRSWGLGTNKIGKLYATETPGTYLWKGHSQGRHGQVWNKRSQILFSVANGEITILERKGGAGLPDHRDVLESVRILETPVPEKKVRKRFDNSVKQLTFDL